ncbi:MAG: glucosamine-6-phosphate deaminase [Oscillospiraceae bacterium]|nr:glucosamine-6-phosphate deaminase [Oscillospiraceae bacterium]
MRVYEAADYNGMSRRAANIISAHVILHPACCLGLATGTTPIGIYEQLIRWYEKGDLDFAATRTVNLDEYRGLGPGHEQSYRYFMNSRFFDHININRENTHLPDGLAADPEAECRRYNAVIRSLGGIRLQLLGLGRNGHIGFNEPGGAFELETHLVALTQSTINANAPLFSSRDAVPRQAFTMGIKSIMQAKAVLVAVSGEDKADIVARAFSGPVTPELPSSILQMHPDVTLVGDRAALHKLKESGVTVCD